MQSERAPFFIAFVRDLPTIDHIVGGEQVRPFELVRVLDELGIEGEVWCVDASSPRKGRTIDVRRIPLPQWPPLREALAPVMTFAIFLWRRASRRRMVLYQRIAGGIAFRGRIPYLLEPGLPLMAVARAFGVKTWASMHDLSPEHERFAAQRARSADLPIRPAELARWGRLAAINEATQRWALPRADCVTVVSTSLKREVTRRYRVSPDDIMIVRAGVNRNMVEDIPAWQPPTERAWVVGYVGSRYDLELGLLLEAIASFDTRRVHLLLAGRGMDEVPIDAAVKVRVVDSSYADFAELASCVDVWVVPIGDDPYLHWGWHLKLPMDLATGRPVVLSRTDELVASNMESLFVVAEPNSAGIRDAVQRILDDPTRAVKHARHARQVVLKSMTWHQQFEPALQRLGFLVN